jgi:[NiFe] hydrogenase assembly HybE family chaperone
MNAHQVDLRVCGLAVRFRQIGDEQMRDLPFYNPQLQVETIEFTELSDDDLIGVLITPWFMNLLVLPLDLTPVDARRYGESRLLALPGGKLQFRYSGDEDIGACWAHSLHSPMHQFATQAQARSEAHARLIRALASPEPRARPANPGRRAFFGGGQAPLGQR